MKKNTIFQGFLVFCALSTGFEIYAQTPTERAKISSGYNKEKITNLSREFLAKERKQKEEAVDFAQKNNLPLTLKLTDGGFAELQKIVNGKPIYYRTFNVAAAKSTRANHLHTGGSLGLNLNGQNMTAYVWDGGHARVSHQEYDGTGGTNRVTVEDAASEGGTKLNFHAAHVTGTITASGFTANAKGMAPQSRVRGYMWNNDLSEATTAASNGMLLSNHSYGYRSDLVEDYYFGAYIDDSRDWDNLLYNAPYYLMVVAAGNDGSTSYNGSPLNSSFPQYDKLTGHATSKNNLVVANANDANIDTNGNLVSVTINSSSSQGPTDDLRIKPDITGNGTSVYSSYETSDSAYGTISGTSMASPNVTGTLLLLQQHYNSLNGLYMKSATLKGLALHTADDAGASGPDAIFGWGLLNAKKAAQAISTKGTSTIINELTLQPGQTYTLNVNSDGVNKLIASICWTDPAGTSGTLLNSGTAKLVNDLDIRISKSGTTYLPWRLTGVNANGLGDNTKDPFERVEVTGASGEYTITITHKGSLTGGSQNYSLVVSGITNNATCSATVPTGVNVTSVTSNSSTVNWSSVPNATYEVRYKETAAATWSTVASPSASTVLSGLTAGTAYEAQVRSLCSGGTASAFSSSVNFTTSTATDTIAPTVPTGLAASGTTTTSTNLTWTASTDNVGVTGYDIFQGGTLIGSSTATSIVVGSLSPATTYTFTVRAKDAAGNFSALSSSVSVTTLSETAVYCASKGNSVADEYIGRVQIGSINNASAGGTGYSDYTSLSTNVTKGSATAITVTPTWTGSTYPEGYAVWIDLNNDKDFNDAGELVWSKAASTTTPAAGSFTVPTTAVTGSTRMRVSMKYNGIPTQCETISYGEVEDYTVNLVAESADTIAPTAPTSLAASGTTAVSTVLSWTASTDNVGVTGYDVYQGAVLKATVTSTSYTVTGLTVATAYTFSVKAKDAAGNVSASSNVVNVITSGTITYCESKGNSVADEYIDYVALGGIANATGANAGYGNFTNLVGNVPYGSNTITFSAGFTGSAYTEYWSVWIDYNQNGTFETTEKVVTGSSSSSTNLTSTFTVPTTALAGQTRMRVQMKYNATSTACETFSYGEVEDYTVNIGASGLTGLNSGEEITNESNVFDLVMYPNPAQTTLNIAMLDNRSVSYRIFNLMGQPLKSGKLNQQGINVSDLASGMYILEVNDGQKSISKKFSKK
ncbi:GEVED domain-containing protein [Flavobacterium sp. H122]|uniref:GEVED domain-containing protein n=1 Tax=Flavobacterium sp. H122 TaxID=2529860 RepID=UPI0010AAC6A0|nr:GEVED domain-containing protein [Flavobacterium sp. H122]